MRTFVVGDIHGYRENLVEVLRLVEFSYEKDRLISLGDLVDRGPDSAGVIEELLKIENIVPLRGNHDYWCLEWLENDSYRDSWMVQGGKETVESYKNISSERALAHKTFFQSQRSYYHDTDYNVAFMHAGYTSEEGLGHEKNEEVYSWDRSMFEIAMSGRSSQTIPKKLKHYDRIFVGHTTTMNWQTTEPIKACNVWNLDTGVAYGGPLTLMNLETEEYFQV